MGVYIPDIKLPKDEPGAFKVIVMYVGADGKLRAECEGTHEVTIVPPHGKLKDADAIEKNLLKMQQAQTGPCSHGVRKSRAVLRDAPTIIPAEPLNEEVNE